MSLYKNCGWWKNFDCIFGFSVKSYVRNPINLSWAKILLTGVISFQENWQTPQFFRWYTIHGCSIYKDVEGWRCTLHRRDECQNSAIAHYTNVKILYTITPSSRLLVFLGHLTLKRLFWIVPVEWFYTVYNLRTAHISFTSLHKPEITHYTCVVNKWNSFKK
jgi:hypothetical protein